MSLRGRPAGWFAVQRGRRTRKVALNSRVVGLAEQVTVLWLSRLLEGIMTDMTPEEAEHFYEEDEDAEQVFAWFDAGPTSVTASPAATQQPVDAEVVSRVLVSGLYGHLRRDLLPEVSAAGASARWAQQA